MSFHWNVGLIELRFCLKLGKLLWVTPTTAISNKRLACFKQNYCFFNTLKRADLADTQEVKVQFSMSATSQSNCPILSAHVATYLSQSNRIEASFNLSLILKKWTLWNGHFRWFHPKNEARFKSTLIYLVKWQMH